MQGMTIKFKLNYIGDVAVDRGPALSYKPRSAKIWIAMMKSNLKGNQFVILWGMYYLDKILNHK